MPSRVILVVTVAVVAIAGAAFFMLNPSTTRRPEAPLTPAAVAPAPVAKPPEPVSAPVAAPAPDRTSSGRRATAAPVSATPASPAPDAPPTTGTIRFTSDVPDTSVFIDRVYLGTAPITVPNVTPGPHNLKMSAAGYDGISETIDVAPGARDYDARFKDVKLDVKLEVMHKHGVGSCAGTLSATPQGLRYETTNKEDAFVAPLADLETFEVDYLNKNLRVKLKKGKTYNFTNGDTNADRLYTFHAEVEKARKRLAGGSGV